MTDPAPEPVPELPLAARSAIDEVLTDPAAPVKLLVSGGIGTGKSTVLAAVRNALREAESLDGDSPNGSQSTGAEVSGGLSEQVEHFERSLIAAELERSHSSMRSLAEALGVPRKTLHDKLRKHGLNFESGSHPHTDELD